MDATQVLALVGIRVGRQRSLRQFARKQREKAIQQWKAQRVKTCGKAQLAQIRKYNKSGFARTKDHLIVPTGERRARVLGKAQWRRWDDSAVLKAAFAPPTMKSRHLATQIWGTKSHIQVSHCAQTTAIAILSGTERFLRRLRQASFEAQFAFVITGSMFDASKLKLRVGRSRFKKYETLASHSQVTWAKQAAEEEVFDEDVLRAPAVFKRCTSAHCWTALSDSLCPPAPVYAKFTGVCTTSDSHAVNKMLLRHARNVLPPDVFVLNSFCVQHGTGSVVEALSKKLGLVGISFCVANTFDQGDFYHCVRRGCERALERTRICTQDEFEALRVDGDDEMFPDALLEATYLKHGHRPDDDVDALHSKRRKFRALRAFFPGKWNGNVRYARDIVCVCASVISIKWCIFGSYTAMRAIVADFLIIQTDFWL